MQIYFTCLQSVCFAIRLVSITVWGVHPQVNRDRRDAFVGACYPVGLCLNFRPHFFEIHKLLPFAVQEFGIFYTEGQRDAHKGREEGEKSTKEKNEQWRQIKREYQIKGMKVADSELSLRHCDREAVCIAAMKGDGDEAVHRNSTLTCFIVDQLQNERSTGNNAWSTWKKVPEWER